MNQSKWFLAHSKQDDNEDIDYWCSQLGEALSQSGWQAKVVPGRDDYSTRSSALGGWKAWCRDVPHGRDYTGAPMFHGVIVPADAVDDEPTVGKATAQILQGFLQESKHVYAWCPASDTFRRVIEVTQLPDDSWTAWARLGFSP